MVRTAPYWTAILAGTVKCKAVWVWAQQVIAKWYGSANYLPLIICKLTCEESNIFSTFIGRNFLQESWSSIQWAILQDWVSYWSIRSIKSSNLNRFSCFNQTQILQMITSQPSWAILKAVNTHKNSTWTLLWRPFTLQALHFISTITAMLPRRKHPAALKSTFNMQIRR